MEILFWSQSLSMLLVVVDDPGGIVACQSTDRATCICAPRNSPVGPKHDTRGFEAYGFFQRNCATYFPCHLFRIQAIDHWISQSVPLDHEFCLILRLGGKDDNLGPKLLQPAQVKLKIGQLPIAVGSPMSPVEDQDTPVSGEVSGD